MTITGMRIGLLVAIVALVSCEERLTIGNDGLTHRRAVAFLRVAGVPGASITGPGNVLRPVHCSVTLIANQWAITAAHCVGGVGAPGFQGQVDVVFGCPDPDGPGCTVAPIPQANRIVHPDFSTGDARFPANWNNDGFGHLNYDIALLFYQPGWGIPAAELAPPVTVAGNPALIANLIAGFQGLELYGWGATEFDILRRVNRIRGINVNLVASATACCETGVRNLGGAQNSRYLTGRAIPNINNWYQGACIGDDGAGLIINDAGQRRLIGVLAFHQGCGTTRASISTYTSVFTPRVANWLNYYLNVAPQAAPFIEPPPAFPAAVAAEAVESCTAAEFTACRLTNYPAIVGVTQGTFGFGGTDNCEDAPFIREGTNFVNFRGATASPVPIALATCQEVDANLAFAVNAPRTFDKWFRITVPLDATRIVIDACQVVPTEFDIPNTAFLTATGDRVAAAASAPVTVALYDGRVMFNANNPFPCSAAVNTNHLRCTSGNTFVNNANGFARSGTCNGGNGAVLHMEFPADPAQRPTELAIRIGTNAAGANAATGNRGNFFVQFFGHTAGQPIPANLPGNIINLPLGATGDCNNGEGCPLGQVCQHREGVINPVCATPSILSTLICAHTSAPNKRFRTVSWLCRINVRDAGNNLILGNLALFNIIVNNGEYEIITPNTPRNEYQFLVTAMHDPTVNINTPGDAPTVDVRLNNVPIAGSNPALSFEIEVSCGVVLPGGGAKCTTGSEGVALNPCLPQGNTVCNPPAQNGIIKTRFNQILTCANPVDPQPPIVALTRAGQIVIDPNCAFVGVVNIEDEAATEIIGGPANTIITFNRLVIKRDDYVTLPDPAFLQNVEMNGLRSVLYGCRTAVVNFAVSAHLNTYAHSAQCRDNALLTARLVISSLTGIQFTNGDHIIFAMQGPITFNTEIGQPAGEIGGIISITQRPTATTIINGRTHGATTALLVVNRGALTLADANLGTTPRNLRMMIATGSSLPDAPSECLSICGNSGHFDIVSGCWAVALTCLNKPTIGTVGTVGISSLAPDTAIVITAFSGVVQTDNTIADFAGVLHLPSGNRLRLVINAVSPNGLTNNQEFILARADSIVGNLVGHTFSRTAASNINAATLFTRAVGPRMELVLRVDNTDPVPVQAPAVPAPTPFPPAFFYNFNLADISRSSALSASSLSVSLIAIVALFSAYLMH